MMARIFRRIPAFCHGLVFVALTLCRLAWLRCRVANAKTSKRTSRAASRPRISPIGWLRRWLLRGCLGIAASLVFLIVLFSIVNPPTTYYMVSESRRLGGIEQDWVAISNMSDVVPRSVVAAEDANFCLHWGFDMSAIRKALDEGAARGASTLSQQVVKNVFLWHGRSWARKALEAILTPAVEAVWTKRRILEVYLNVAEFDEGVFGVGAAAQHYFGVSPDKLTALQAARLAAVLPNPKDRSASKPTAYIRKRTGSIIDGAATIRADGRSECFES